MAGKRDDLRRSLEPTPRKFVGTILFSSFGILEEKKQNYTIDFTVQYSKRVGSLVATHTYSGFVSSPPVYLWNQVNLMLYYMIITTETSSLSK